MWLGAPWLLTASAVTFLLGGSFRRRSENAAIELLTSRRVVIRNPSGLRRLNA